MSSTWRIWRERWNKQLRQRRSFKLHLGWPQQHLLHPPWRTFLLCLHLHLRPIAVLGGTLPSLLLRFPFNLRCPPHSNHSNSQWKKPKSLSHMKMMFSWVVEAKTTSILVSTKEEEEVVCFPYSFFILLTHNSLSFISSIYNRQ